MLRFGSTPLGNQSSPKIASVSSIAGSIHGSVSASCRRRACHVVLDSSNAAYTLLTVRGS